MKRVFLAAWCVCALFAFAGEAHAAPACPEGSVPAGWRCANDADIAAGLPAGKPVNPATDAKAVNSNEAGPAKEYLKSLRRGTGSCGTTSDWSFSALDSKFAVCAAKFLKDYQAKYGTVYITSATRSPQMQKCVCPRVIDGICGGLNSNHIKGIALDVHPTNGNYQQMWAFAKANPSYGMGFPLAPGDKPHMQPTNKSDPNCVAGDISANYPQVTGAPLSLGNALRSYLAPPAPPPAPISPAPQTIGQPTTQAVQSAFQPTPAPTPVSTTLAGETGGTSPSGTSSLSGDSEGGAVDAYKESVSSQLSDLSSEKKAGTSTLDLLASLAYGTSTSATATDVAHAIDLTIDTSVASGLRPMVQDAPFAGLIPDVIYQYFVPQGGVPSTFVSPDLSGDVSPYYTPSAPQSQFSYDLERLRAFLVTLLGYLQPFGPRGEESVHGVE